MIIVIGTIGEPPHITSGYLRVIDDQLSTETPPGFITYTAEPKALDDLYFTLNERRELREAFMTPVKDRHRFIHSKKPIQRPTRPRHTARSYC